MKRSFIREILESIDDETISFAGGLPNEALFPLKELQKANAECFKDAKNLQYTLTQGSLHLREKIAKMYNLDGFATDAKNILITSGSQQALFIIAMYFKNKKIIVEEPSYLGATKTFELHSLIQTPLKLYEDGIDILAFKDACKESKLSYLIPDFQNPSGASYSEEKRIEIAQILKESGSFLIEDAPYSELYFTKKRRSISSFIPKNSFHLGSFSKTLSPAFRLGWLRASEEFIGEFMKIKELIDLHSNGIAQETLSNYLEKPSLYEKHLCVVRENYKKRMEFFTKALKAYLPAFEFIKPEGGMFIYGSLKGVDTSILLKECMKKGVVFVPAVEFLQGEEKSDALRFNFTHSSKEETIKGLKSIASVYRSKILERKKFERVAFE